MARQKDFPLDSLLRDSDTWSTSMHWPAPLHRRLDDLVDLAVAAGEPTALSRAELVAALIFSAPEIGDQLREMLRRFRVAKVLETVVGRDSLATDSKVITLASRRPGRRRA